MKLQFVLLVAVLACAFAAPAADVDNIDQSKPAVDPAKVDEDGDANIQPQGSAEAPKSSEDKQESVEVPKSSEDKQDSAEAAKSSDDTQDFEKTLKLVEGQLDSAEAPELIETLDKLLKSIEDQKDSAEAPKSGEDQQDSAEGNQYRTLNDVQKGQEGLIQPAENRPVIMEWNSLYGTHNIDATVPVDVEFPDNWMDFLQALHPGNPTLNDDEYLV